MSTISTIGGFDFTDRIKGIDNGNLEGMYKNMFWICFFCVYVLSMKEQCQKI